MQDALPEIERRIRAGGQLALFLDFDGTLAPIQEDPSTVSLSPEMFEILQRCAERYPLCIVTGRALADIRTRAAISRAKYAGNHGMEWWDGMRTGMTPLSREALSDIDAARRLLKPLSATPGVILEDKEISIAFHYRGVAKDLLAGLLAQTHAALAPLVAHGHIEILEQKQALDVRPKGWHKGDFIALQLRQMPPGTFPVFIGDDATDEDAFQMLDGIMIRVGTEGGSAARYGAPSIAAVQTFLERLLKLD